MPIHQYLSFIVKLLVILLGFMYWNKFSIPYKLLTIQCLVVFLVEAWGKYLNTTTGQNNVSIFNGYSLVELWLLGYIGLELIPIKSKKFFVYALVLLTVFWMYNLSSYGPTQFFNWYFVLHCFFLLILYTTVLFTKAMFNRKVLWKQPLFLICLSLIVYYACTIPLFGTINYLVQSNMKMAANLFYISHIINILRYFLIAIAFYLYGSQAKMGYVQQ